ncbi:hypothetical protein B0T20DRAFT_407567 [Sordaria brevicollis]|uniref:Uncharacterized protein n=1 Tax=Sordaria brevicollis TaxID=83679 RepID=A0AAE0PHL5_SORBR|nr:hypothetical protein B0T20DRAFT_407567 [Sordaria brevicollis]
MALTRIRELNRNGWQEIWAKYSTSRPFATPGRYLRTGMLLALTANSEVISPGELEKFVLQSETDVPRLILAEEDMKRVRAEVAKLAKYEEEKEDEDWTSDFEEITILASTIGVLLSTSSTLWEVV